ncbi:MAG TPA: hypothetical protein VMU90_05480 [Solirubrobacteraceae bacterium]|nr:hypothetical protein [Solirubrobacteraceae bacterium]
MTAWVALAAIAAAAGLAAYAAYGDPHPKANQQAGVPFLIVVSVVVGVAVFAGLVPKGLRAIRAAAPSAPRWAVGFGAVAVVSCAAFWSGVPIVIGAAAALLGIEGRRGAATGATTARPYNVATVLAVVTIVASTAFVVLGNTVLSHS